MGRDSDYSGVSMSDRRGWEPRDLWYIAHLPQETLLLLMTVPDVMCTSRFKIFQF